MLWCSGSLFQIELLQEMTQHPICHALLASQDPQGLQEEGDKGVLSQDHP